MVSETDELRKRLERMGVRLGLQGLRPRPAEEPPPEPARPPAPPRDAIEDWVSGRMVQTEAGECFLSEARYPHAHLHGDTTLGALLAHAPALLEDLAGNGRPWPADFTRFVFLDTETTGGTGTYAFMVGLGTYEDGDFVVRQYFMRDLPDERAVLALVRGVLEPRQGLVTFNGRAFDWPLLEARFAMNRQVAPAISDCHLDLLLPARRLWRLRLTSCALSSLEEHVLGLARSEDDVPGWAIPGLYRDYLTWGRAEPLRKVFYHNAHDILSLATLAERLCRSVQEPVATLQHGEDLFSLGRHYEAQGDVERAVQLYGQCLRCPLPPAARHEVMHRLAQIHRRAGEQEEAVSLWHALAERADCHACIELAKHYEHRVGDLAQARRLTLQALSHLQKLRYPDRRAQREVEHRLERLSRKLERRSCQRISDTDCTDCTE